ncbi:biotin/lipoyl-binding protein [Prolixibacteraceae bacterium JC049]|jgi:biotin carboxyl carrier protein|nr:biotin/lipoyl-binding protein [Prolixibacteraceae bacterium JC049]
MKKFKFTISGREYEVEVKDFEDNIAEVEVNGTAYQVEIDQEVKTTKTPKLVRKPVAKQPGEGQIERKPAAAAGSGSGAVIKAPLPGTIVKVSVREGDSVTKGQTILTMEAMKMENSVMAEVNGVIKAINVKEGDAVLQDDLLVEIA